jgi:hypothetical protein
MDVAHPQNGKGSEHQDAHAAAEISAINGDQGLRDRRSYE